MADIKISQLTAKGANLASSDLIEISESDGQGGYVTKSVTGANVLSTKQNTLVSGTNIKTIENQSLLGAGNIDLSKSDVGLGNVDNTSDLSKPISTATQTALNNKQNTIVNSDSITEGSTNLFLTTAERTKLVNTSGTNTGDQTNISGTANNVTGIVAVANGGTGTATPNLVAGTNVTITGTFPNQTINAAGGGGGGVTQIVAGTNVTISPAGGTGVVTVNAAGGGGGGFHMLTQPIATPTNFLYAAQGIDVNYSITSLSNGVNTMQLSLFYPATTFTISELSINVTTAASSASNVKILVYSDDGFGYPRAKLIESSALSMLTTGTKVFLTSYTFTAGTKYWMGVIIDAQAGAQVTSLSTNQLYTRHFNYSSAHSGMSITATFASPPALNTVAATSGGFQAAAVFLKI